MKIISYDGSFDGLLTVIFDYYKEIYKIKIERDSKQIDFLEKIFVETDSEKAYRVKKAIKDKFSTDFLLDIGRNFKSKDKYKDDLIGRVIRASFHYGENFLTSSNKLAVKFRENAKNYNSELHTFKGLLRFREIDDGYLFARFFGENNILEDLAFHFVKRMPEEKFVIYDENRKKAIVSIYSNPEQVDILDLKIKDSDEEKLFKSLWIKFYDSISIKERENKKLMISNMPKKYWKNLLEKSRMDKSDS